MLLGETISPVEKFKAVMVNTRSFQGDLSLLSAVNLFQLIGLASLSGHMKMSCARNSIHFVFSDGKLSYASSRVGHKKIGQSLLDSQLITTDQLKSCLAEQKTAEKWQKLGSIAVKNGYLRESHLTDLFYEQLKQAIFEVITWEEGKFTFVDTSPLTEEDIVLEENIEPLLMQAVILIDGPVSDKPVAG